MNEQNIKQIINTLERSQKIVILPSAPLDGDSIGSALALYEVLKKMDKEVTVICADTVPDVLRFLPDNQMIHHKFLPSQDFIVTLNCERSEVDNIHYNVEKNKVNVIITPKAGTYKPEDVTFHYGPTKYDLIVTVDTATFGQLGIIYDSNIEFFYQTPIINIDHHASNEYFGSINLVDVTAASTTEILLQIIEGMGKEKNLIDSDIATLLLAGIITDTGSFQNANTTPRSFSIAAKLLRFGARQQEIIKNVYKTKELSTLKLWGSVLSKLKYDSKLKIVWSSISKEDFEETRSKPEDTGGIIDELMSNAPNAEVILLMKEKEPNLISCSLRTTTPAINASNLAGNFGGGGHPQAAGFRIRKNLHEAETMVLAYLKEMQAKRLNIDLATINGEEEKIKFSEIKNSEGKEKNERKENKNIEDENEVKELENPLGEIIAQAEDEEDEEKELKNFFYRFGAK